MRVSGAMIVIYHLKKYIKLVGECDYILRIRQKPNNPAGRISENILAYTLVTSVFRFYNLFRSRIVLFNSRVSRYSKQAGYTCFQPVIGDCDYDGPLEWLLKQSYYQDYYSIPASTCFRSSFIESSKLSNLSRIFWESGSL